MNNHVSQHHYGERLRLLLSQSYVTYSELRALIRKRGTFFPADSTKDQLIPFLTGGLLRPSELSHLMTLACNREAAPKRRSSMVICEDPRTLSDIVASEIDVAALVDQQYRNYDIVEISNVYAVGGDGNEIKIDYKVSRNDLSQGWSESKKEFNASVTLKKIDQNVQIASVHSSGETEQINNAIKRHLISSFPSVKQEEVKLLFSTFNNAGRVRFLLSFTKLQSDLAFFDRATDLGVRPDEHMGDDFKTELRWMLQKVSELRLNGEAVHEVEFMADDSYHDSILTTRMEAKFGFNNDHCEGTYVATFEFADYSRKKGEAEFQISINSVKIIRNASNLSINQISNLIFEALEREKMEFMEPKVPV